MATSKSTFRGVLDRLIASPADAFAAIEAIGEIAADGADTVEHAWQERGAGRPWRVITKTLDSALHRIHQELKRVGYR